MDAEINFEKNMLKTLMWDIFLKRFIMGECLELLLRVIDVLNYGVR
jgi:hypothetical protein